MKNLRAPLVLFALLTLLTGAVYPAVVTGLAQLLWPGPANGSLIEEGGRVVGSRLIGQPFARPEYFWGRPSALATPYDARASGASNLGPTNPALRAAVAARVEAWHAADPGQHTPIPIDLVTASGSGLDPDISVAGAFYQVPRIARARGLPEGTILALISRIQRLPVLGLFGAARVNVLALNMELDRLRGGRHEAGGQ